MLPVLFRHTVLGFVLSVSSRLRAPRRAALTVPHELAEDATRPWCASRCQCRLTNCRRSARVQAPQLRMPSSWFLSLLRSDPD